MGNFPNNFHCISNENDGLEWNTMEVKTKALGE